jgi:hypothetical protein
MRRPWKWGPVILSRVADPRLVTIRRGGSLTDADHRVLAAWAALCAEHVLPLFESAQPNDDRPRLAIEAARSWITADASMTSARAAGGHSMRSARDLAGAPRFAAYAAGQAACVAHVAAHDLGAAAYAIKSVRTSLGDVAGRDEREWQRTQLPSTVRALVLDDQSLRDGLCWSMFSY